MAGVPLPKYSKEEEARDEKRKTLHEVMELAAKFFEATLAGARRRQGARLSRRPRPRCRDAVEIPARLCAGRALRAEGASRRAGRQRRGHGRDRPADRRRRHPGALRPLPRPGDVSDHRFPRPHHRLRRPRAVSRRAGEISQLAGDAALSQGLEPLQRRRRAPGGARRRGADRGRGLCRRDRHGRRPAIRRRSRRSAPRSPRISSACSGRWRTSRSSASTATRPASARPIAPSTWRCRG